ncbi:MULTISPECIES: Crp/Fnr family transcriptional regulator [unclassified Methylobacterium]|jgi:CRP-like cAMP-binding protein|uniref:Crp/Fnr family transcriptional regulator n=1 Tax=unclassified Methylobacterium TaxID=2615210 RepID=UPI0006F1FEEB|nr:MULTISPECIES: Crp/Fnr family transcriptional regulator [unclassified Methylobacterium]KQO70615.1 CarD family transcriptional regulator [Methylobacterium sp. Leaf88]KQP51250.1 CarD family transcriptional regulator [Methylobacterium sp. Leaf111]KQU16257.1 CarD family transcriptional regulator [Methylobacterium sp. Leaf94]
MPDPSQPRSSPPDPVRQATVRNRLLRAMGPEDFARLAPHLEPMAGALRQLLIRPNQPVERLYFPESGFVSIVTEASAGRVEIGLVGREGLVGATPILLDSDRTPHHAFVQSAGRLLAIDAPALLAAVGQSPSLRHLLLRFVQVQIVHLGKTAFANATFTLEVRLAACLLMCHDRIDGDDIAITHAFLALMLGVRRSGTTLAVQNLEGQNLIRARRGRITILDRPALRALADGSYGTAEAEYARLIGGA